MKRTVTTHSGEQPSGLTETSVTPSMAPVRANITIDEALWREAKLAAGVSSHKRLIELALRALIESSARQRLAAGFGSIPTASAPARRRSKRKSA